MPRVSVVLISRNQAWNIARLIESVLREVDGADGREIVLVDSASDDATVALASQFSITIICLHGSQRLTAALGRYIGFHHTTGEHILFLDGDMELIPGWMAGALNVLDQHGEIAAITGRLIDQLPPRDPGARGPNPAAGWSDGPLEVVSHGGGAALYRRNILERVGTFDPRLYSDEEPELCLRIRHAGYRIVRTRAPIAYHYSEPRYHLATVLHRRQRHLYLGLGQNIRHHLRSPLLWPYLRERGFGLAPGALIMLATGGLIQALLARRPRQVGAILGAGAVLIGVDIVRRRSVSCSLFAFAQRLVVLEGTVRGFLLHPIQWAEFRPSYEVLPANGGRRSIAGQGETAHG